MFDKLGTGRDLATFGDRIIETYPFHPDLFTLAAKEWTVVQAFQRVRSTVKIFARTALHWSDQAKAGSWIPQLIGVGDIPLGTEALESLLSSGVLAGNDRAVQGYRAVATNDIVDSSGGGNAVAVDGRLAAAGVSASQPSPAVRMATACFAYSLVARARGSRGATKPELLAALYGVGVPYGSCEEVFNSLVAGPNDGGLRALERTTKVKGEDRYYLTIKQTLNMYHGNALAMISNDLALDRVWETAQKVASKGTFALVKFVEPVPSGQMAEAFKDLDSTENKLVVLDPRHWTIGNGHDRATRTDLDVMFGVKPGRTATYAASLVVACASTPRRDRARNSARDCLAWEHVVAQLQPEDEEFGDASSRRDGARTKLEADVRRAFEHYAFVVRKPDGLVVEYKGVAETESTLSGSNVWSSLVVSNRAAGSAGLNSSFLAALLDGFDRPLTPKELFQQPYSNPSWPLIANDDHLRQAVFRLITTEGWTLLDSESNEVAITSAGQIQTASMQQVLTRRIDDAEPTAGGHPGQTTARTESGSPSSAESPERTGPATPVTQIPSAHSVEYEKTTIVVTYGSLTAPETRDQTWRLLRELARLVDPSNAGTSGVEMAGFQIQLSATAGATGTLIAQAEILPTATTNLEEDL